MYIRTLAVSERFTKKPRSITNVRNKERRTSNDMLRPLNLSHKYIEIFLQQNLLFGNFHALFIKISERALYFIMIGCSADSMKT